MGWQESQFDIWQFLSGFVLRGKVKMNNFKMNGRICEFIDDASVVRPFIWKWFEDIILTVWGKTDYLGDVNNWDHALNLGVTIILLKENLHYKLKLIQILEKLLNSYYPLSPWFISQIRIPHYSSYSSSPGSDVGQLRNRTFL